MKTFKYNTRDQYIQAIASASKASERETLVKEYQQFTAEARKQASIVANAKAKAEADARVEDSVRKGLGNFKMQLQLILNELNGSDTLEAMVNALNDSQSAPTQALVKFLTEQQNSFIVREQWNSGQRHLEVH